MSVICTTSEKGGSGKTTVVTNLAVYLASRGRSVVIFDLDAQQSVGAWMAMRTRQDTVEVYEGIEVMDLEGIAEARGQGSLKELVERASARWDDVLLDVPGSDNALQREALLASDVAIMPIVPDGFDHLTSMNSFDFIEEAIEYRSKTRGYTPLKAYLMFNRDYDRSVALRMARDAYSGYLEHMEILEPTFRMLNDYRSAASQGLGVIEWNAFCRAAREVKALGEALTEA